MGLLDHLPLDTAPLLPEDSKPAPAPKIDPATGLRPLSEPVWGRMVEGYNNGLKKGETTHITQLDPLFTWMPGYLNVWTGWMNEGKTEWIYQLLLIRAALAGKKAAIYSPENMDEEHIYNQLIHSLTGQNPDRDWKNCLPMNRYQIAKAFVREHFVIIYPPRGGGRTPQHLLEYFEAAVSKDGVSHCLIDPWNTADHSGQSQRGAGDSYLANTLSGMQTWALDTKQSLIITAHPRQLPDMKQGQARPIPDSSHISGGQMWENMAHVVGTYYRPWKHLGTNSDQYSDVAIYVHKVKSRKLCGVAGSIGDGSLNPDVRITYSWETGRYYINGTSPLERREVEAFYIPAAELNAHHAVPAAAPQPPTPRSLPASTFEAEAPNEYPAEAFGPRKINSSSLNP
jgi:hypothetical protein